MTEQDEAVRLREALSLARAIRSGEWYREAKKSLSKGVYPTWAQIIALVDRLAATPPPVPAAPRIVENAYPSQVIGGKPRFDAHVEAVPAAPPLDEADVERLATALKSRYGLKESPGEIAAFLFAIIGTGRLARLARLTGQQEDGDG